MWIRDTKSDAVNDKPKFLEIWSGLRLHFHRRKGGRSHPMLLEERGQGWCRKILLEYRSLYHFKVMRNGDRIPHMSRGLNGSILYHIYSVSVTWGIR